MNTRTTESTNSDYKNDLLNDITWKPVADKEFTNDPQDKIAVGGIKYDGGKAPVFRGAIDYFPRAISAVASISAFGASKYAWKGWESVADGYNRYSDAMVRHLIYEGEGEVLDRDSGLLHAAHTAWNALARLELLIKERNLVKGSPELEDHEQYLNLFKDGC